jgi:hypothetical protein
VLAPALLNLSLMLKKSHFVQLCVGMVDKAHSLFNLAWVSSSKLNDPRERILPRIPYITSGHTTQIRLADRSS